MKTNLQAMRKRAGFTSARDFAEKHGLNVGSYTNLEQGSRNMSLEKAWELADMLDCTLDDLAGRSFKPASNLPKDEASLISNYRSCTDEQKHFVLVSAENAAGMSLNRAESGSLVRKDA